MAKTTANSRCKRVRVTGSRYEGMGVYVYTRANGDKLYEVRKGVEKRLVSQHLTSADALAASREYEHWRHLGFPDQQRPVRSSVTLAELGEEWLGTKVGNRPSSVEDCRKALKRINADLGTRLVKSLTRQDCELFKKRLLASYKTTTTPDKTIGYLNRFSPSE